MKFNPLNIVLHVSLSIVKNIENRRSMGIELDVV